MQKKHQMKQKLVNSIKSFHQKSISISDIIIIAMFLLAITYSIKNNSLFLRELAICGFIVGMTILHKKTK